MAEEVSWLEQARRLVKYHEEALGFIHRVAQELPASPDDAPAVSRLWLEAERLDTLVCGLLDEMNQGLMDGKGELDTTRGASPRPSTLGDEGVLYECAWALNWGDGKGVSVSLTVAPRSGVYESQARGLRSQQARRLRFPFVEADLKEALVAAYVWEATLGSSENPRRSAGLFS